MCDVRGQERTYGTRVSGLATVPSELNLEVLLKQQSPIDRLALVGHEQETELLSSDSITIILKVNLAKNAAHPGKPRVLVNLPQGENIIPAVLSDGVVEGAEVRLRMRTCEAPFGRSKAVPAKELVQVPTSILHQDSLDHPRWKLLVFWAIPVSCNEFVTMSNVNLALQQRVVTSQSCLRGPDEVRPPLPLHDLARHKKGWDWFLTLHGATATLTTWVLYRGLNVVQESRKEKRQW